MCRVCLVPGVMPRLFVGEAALKLSLPGVGLAVFGRHVEDLLGQARGGRVREHRENATRRKGGRAMTSEPTAAQHVMHMFHTNLNRFNPADDPREKSQF